MTNEEMKAASIIHFAKPADDEQLQNLINQMDLFDFIPGIKNAEEYGRYMIVDSGHFEYDENLEGYYNFAKYGQHRIANEFGGFSSYGYITYNGFVSLEEVMAGVQCERQDFTMQME